MSTPTEFTVRPNAAPTLSRPEKPIFGVYTPGDSDTISMREALSALNPIHHIPFVSHLVDSTEGADTNRGAAASVGKLVMGGLLGGPIGFLASLANVVFEQQTGESMIASALGAITGKESPVQVARADTAVDPVQQEILAPEAMQLSALEAQNTAHEAQMQLASAIADVGHPATGPDGDVLSLFGGQPASAHKSYQKARMLPYLRDVTTSQVI